jgi:hypothetical protein
MHIVITMYHITSTLMMAKEQPKHVGAMNKYISRKDTKIMVYLLVIFLQLILPIFFMCPIYEQN